VTRTGSRRKPGRSKRTISASMSRPGEDVVVVRPRCTQLLHKRRRSSAGTSDWRADGWRSPRSRSPWSAGRAVGGRRPAAVCGPPCDASDRWATAATDREPGSRAPPLGGCRSGRLAEARRRRRGQPRSSVAGGEALLDQRQRRPIELNQLPAPPLQPALRLGIPIDNSVRGQRGHQVGPKGSPGHGSVGSSGPQPKRRSNATAFPPNEPDLSLAAPRAPHTPHQLKPIGWHYARILVIADLRDVPRRPLRRKACGRPTALGSDACDRWLWGARCSAREHSSGRPVVGRCGG
jgi:hypothetical protein